jgi:hypothetical protein
MRFSAVLMGLAMLAAPALAQDTPTTDADGRLDVRTLPATGQARQCLPLRDVQQSRPVGQDVILFRTGANRWFRNDLRSNCPALRDHRTLVFRAASGSVCEMDIVDVVDVQTRTNFGFCGLGAFTPVSLPKGARLSG